MDRIDPEKIKLIEAMIKVSFDCGPINLGPMILTSSSFLTTEPLATIL